MCKWLDVSCDSGTCHECQQSDPHVADTAADPAFGEIAIWIRGQPSLQLFFNRQGYSTLILTLQPYSSRIRTGKDDASQWTETRTGRQRNATQHTSRDLAPSLPSYTHSARPATRPLQASQAIYRYAHSYLT